MSSDNKDEGVAHSALRSARAFFLSPQHASNGISGFDSPKFYVVFLLYVSSFLLLAHDGFFMLGGEFNFRQGIMPMLMAYMVVAMFCWELSLFGVFYSLLASLVCLPFISPLQKLLSNLFLQEI